MNNNYDFSGWATKNNLRCSDGRIIKQDAFKHNDGKKVPLMWNHEHHSPSNVIGHAVLKNESEGVYAYCFLNNSKAGQDAKEAVLHGDVDSLSIYANHLQQNGSEVIHGSIREVSLVVAGANPGAKIESIIEHMDGCEEEAIIHTGETFELFHSEEKKEESEEKEEKEDKKEMDKEKTVGDVIESMNEDQKKVVQYLVAEALAEKDNNKEGEDEEMKHNLFENDEQENVLTHADTEAIFADAKRSGSLKEAVLKHGIEHIDYLFPEAKTLTAEPEFYKRDTGWVSVVLNGVHRTPFSRIKSVFANITEDDARAKGYIKGNKKKEEVFTLLKRTTGPQTIYKLQKIDRDDVIDITDFDAVAFLKKEMRLMLDEEIARAALVGDGRSTSSDDHISETNIRPIWKDDDFYTIKTVVEIAATDDENARAKKLIRAAIKARKDYKGSGSPIFFTTEDVLTDMLLLEDATGRTIYDSEDKLATALRVKKIVTVPVMDNLTRTADGKTMTLQGLILNLNDYNIGADKGGAVNMFDDFDINYNKYEYLIETRCSGALVRPYSAIALETTPAAS